MGGVPIFYVKKIENNVRRVIDCLVTQSFEIFQVIHVSLYYVERC